MKKLRSALAGRMGDFALLGGAVLVSVGAGMFCTAAGLMVGGGLLMLGAILGGGDE